MKNFIDFVNDCYTVKTYLKCYDPYILLVNGDHEWMDINVKSPLPPSYGRAPGRPKKQRRKFADEIQQTKKTTRRVGQVCMCTYCGNRGHNTRTCKLRNEAAAAAS